MRTVDIHHARTHLSRLVEAAAAGEPFVIAKAGKPVVKVVPLDVEPEQPLSRIGFLDGHISVPDDFDTMGQAEIERLFSV